MLVSCLRETEREGGWEGGRERESEEGIKCELLGGERGREREKIKRGVGEEGVQGDGWVVEGEEGVTIQRGKRREVNLIHVACKTSG